MDMDGVSQPKLASCMRVTTLSCHPLSRRILPRNIDSFVVNSCTRMLLRRTILLLLVHGVASGLKEWKGSQSRDDEKLPVDCAGLGAGFPDKEPMPTAPYTCIGINLGLSGVRTRPPEEVLWPKTDTSILLYPQKYKPPSTLGGSRYVHGAGAQKPRPAAAASKRSGRQRGAPTHAAPPASPFAGLVDMVTVVERSDLKVLLEDHGLLSWFRHVRRSRSLTLVCSVGVLRSVVAHLKLHAARYERVGPIHFVDVRFFDAKYGAGKVAQAVASATEDWDGLVDGDGGGGGNGGGGNGGSGLDRPEGVLDTGSATNAAGWLPSADWRAPASAAATAAVAAGHAAGGANLLSCRGEGGVSGRAGASECASLVKLHLFDLPFVLDDVVAMDPHAVLAQDVNFVFPNGSALYLSHLPPRLAPLAEAAAAPGHRALKLWAAFKRQHGKTYTTRGAEAAALVEFMAQLDAAAAARRREKWAPKTAGSAVVAGRSVAGTNGTAATAAAAAAASTGIGGDASSGAVLVTGAKLRLWEKFKASEGRAFGSAAAEAGGLKLFLEALAAKEEEAAATTRANRRKAWSGGGGGRAMGAAAAAAVGADESSAVVDAASAAASAEPSALARAATGLRMPTADELTAWGHWKAAHGGVKQCVPSRCPTFLLTLLWRTSSCGGVFTTFDFRSVITMAPAPRAQAPF